MPEENKNGQIAGLQARIHELEVENLAAKSIKTEVLHTPADEPVIKANGFGIKITTLVQIGLLLATLVGGWYKLRTEFNDLKAQVIKIDGDIDVIQNDVVSLAAKDQERFTAVREAFNQLRESLGMTPIPPGKYANPPGEGKH